MRYILLYRCSKLINSSYSRKFTKRYFDIKDVFELSRAFSSYFFRVRVYDTNNREFDDDCTIHDGNIIYVNGKEFIE